MNVKIIKVVMRENALGKCRIGIVCCEDQIDFLAKSGFIVVRLVEAVIAPKSGGQFFAIDSTRHFWVERKIKVLWGAE